MTGEARGSGRKRTGTRAAVLGAGSWGTTLAVLLDEIGHDVALWEFFPELAEAVSRAGENRRFLPGVRVPSSIRITSDLAEALEGASRVVFVTPSHTMRAVARAAAASGELARDAIVISAAWQSAGIFGLKKWAAIG